MQTLTRNAAFAAFMLIGTALPCLAVEATGEKPYLALNATAP